jgi:Arc/MetJ family transcription regulator
MKMRTNIVIDDEIMRTAMEVSGIRTKKGVVEQAMREFVARHTRKNLSDLRGQVRFADDYDYTVHRKDK